MNVDKAYIQAITASFHESFKQEKYWCSISEGELNPQNYALPKFQKIYALRYLPAYYFEYCALAAKLEERLNNKKITSPTIMSLGCGLSPDYAALMHNLSVPFNYHGYDASIWETKSLMPEVKRNYHFHHLGISAIPRQQIEETDIFIFPKSIGDINHSDPHGIDNFARQVAATQKQVIFFLNSFIARSENANSYQIDIFKKVNDALLANGFKTDDNYKVTYYTFVNNGTPPKGQALIVINNNFQYDTSHYIECDNKNSCKRECSVIKKPILRNSYMEYQILEYYK